MTSKRVNQWCNTVLWEGFQTTFPHFVVNVTTQNLWSLVRVTFWFLVIYYNPFPQIAQFGRTDVERGYSKLHPFQNDGGLRNLLCSGNVVAASPRSVPRYDASELWRLYLWPHDLVLWDGDYVADGIKEKGAPHNTTTVWELKRMGKFC